MTDESLQPEQHFRSFQDLVSHIREKGLGRVDSREWHEEWANRWVVYADLIAIKSRARRSEAVLLNNIVRFDRASTLAAAAFPKIDVRRFSDATFAVANTFHEAMAFGVALAHACLAFNREYLIRGHKPFFSHLIVPRITVASGRVLLVRSNVSDQGRLKGINRNNILAGSGVVNAYDLERCSAGGLITIDRAAAKFLSTMTVRGEIGQSRSAICRWLPRLVDKAAVDAGSVFFHRGAVIDVPWLLLRPYQGDNNCLWAADKAHVKEAVGAFLDVWRTSIKEFYSPQAYNLSLDIVKHYEAAVRHGVQVIHAATGRKIPKYESIHELELRWL